MHNYVIAQSKQNVNVQTEMHLKEKIEIAKTNTPFILNEVDVIYLRKCICLKTMKIHLIYSKKSNSYFLVKLKSILIDNYVIQLQGPFN